ncbi:hypothetical protein PoB_000315400 [Plakobranchus ocellatus]|uniref:Uncharacterized protein n=1 Tax=Plakobranchus ocellatus TaxID=259542 RepID=A0AAV3Y127_9GAST|nr:hypothetical protein PoB_000315400 [Plakobranchus ocellatus]
MAKGWLVSPSKILHSPRMSRGRTCQTECQGHSRASPVWGTALHSSSSASDGGRQTARPHCDTASRPRLSGFLYTGQLARLLVLLYFRGHGLRFWRSFLYKDTTDVLADGS